MAKSEPVEERKARDKLTAHLALGVVEEPAKTSACLSSEDMANVAANCCSPEKRAAALDHFGQCQECYDAWVAICFSLAAAERGTTHRGSSFFSLRNLSYLGSAMAIAASVVVVVNSIDAPLTTQPPSSTDSDVRRQIQQAVPEETAKRFSQQAETVTSRGGSGDALLEKQTVARKEDQVQDKPGQKAAADTGRQARQEFSTGALSDSNVPADAVQQWLARIHSLCTGKGHISGAAMTRLQQEGDRLVDSTSYLKRRDRYDEVRGLLSLAGSEQPVVICQRIRALLASEQNWE